MSGETGEIVKKLTKFGLQQLDKNNPDVFQQDSQATAAMSQTLSAIIQKAVLITLNHVAKVADAESAEAFSAGTAE